MFCCFDFLIFQNSNVNAKLKDVTGHIPNTWGRPMWAKLSVKLSKFRIYA